jgi:hypothetical protein
MQQPVAAPASVHSNALKLSHELRLMTLPCSALPCPAWTRQVVLAAPPGQVYVSVYESGSNDTTPRVRPRHSCYIPAQSMHASTLVLGAVASAAGADGFSCMAIAWGA